MKSKNKPKREKKKSSKKERINKVNNVTGYFNPWLYKYFKMDE